MTTMDRRSFCIGSSVGLAAFSAIRLRSRPKVEARSREDGIYAERGEKTYCAEGCHIGQFGNTVRVGSMPKTGDLVPVDGMSIGASACPFCAAPVTANWGEYYFAAPGDLA